MPGEHKWGGAAGEIRWSIIRKRIGCEWKFPMRASLLLTCLAALGTVLPGIGAAAVPAPGANAAPAPPAPAAATMAYITTDTDIGTPLDSGIHAAYSLSGLPDRPPCLDLVVEVLLLHTCETPGIEPAVTEALCEEIGTDTTDRNSRR